MDRRIQRFGIRIGRGWAVLFLLIGALLIAAYWIGPLRPLPAQVELLALSDDRPAEQVTAVARRFADGTIMFAVPLTVRNVGARTARPRRVALSLPAHFRLATATHGRMSGVVTAGLPLRRFVIDLTASELPPDSSARPLPGLDTIFIEPDLPRYYCTTQGLSIPEFSSAPRFDPATLSDVRIFYSFTDAAGPERHTGVIAVNLDPSRLQVTPAPTPPAFPTIVEEPEASAPDVGPLAFAGVRRTHCGDPDRPVELYTVLWETRSGGRVFVLYVDNVGRKRLYDMNRDGVIELETWDGDADGRFEARRDARYAVPDFLMPLPPRDPSLVMPDPERPDSAWLALFHDAGAGPHRFARSTLTAHPPMAVAAAADTTRAARRADPAADLGPVRPADPAFLSLFADTAAGPFRFSQRPRAAPPVAARRAPARDTPAAGVAPGEMRLPAADTAVAEPEPPAEDTAPPRPRPRPRKPPLGTPIRH
ncbi:MAG TPA: hypothetical protein VFZ24_14865 [Longimicrobiales bacterium]